MSASHPDGERAGSSLFELAERPDVLTVSDKLVFNLIHRPAQLFILRLGPGGFEVDVLSEVLKVVRLTGAVFFNAEFSAPWSFRSPPSTALCRYVSAEDCHVIIYHLLTEGCGWAQLEQGPRVQISPANWSSSLMATPT